MSDLVQKRSKQEGFLLSISVDKYLSLPEASFMGHRVHKEKNQGTHQVRDASSLLVILIANDDNSSI